MAKMDRCYSCVKYLMFAFNFLFWVLGCAVLGVGIWIKVDPQSIHMYLDPTFRAFLDESSTFGYLSIGAYILIGVGSVIMIIGFLGCCGAIRESQCMLVLFFLLLFVIFAILLATGVYEILMKNQMEKYIQETLIQKVKNYRKDESAKKLMDFIQTTFLCCGATENAALDYGGDIPSSCKDKYVIRPCPVQVYNELAPNLILIAGVAIGIAAVLVLGMLFSLMLCCVIRDTMV